MNPLKRAYLKYRHPAGPMKINRTHNTSEPQTDRIDDPVINASARWNPIFTISYDGEKTPGEIGDIINWIPDFVGLRARSWQSFIESDITQLVIRRYITAIIGTGLKLQAKPIMSILEGEAVALDREDFSSTAEARFRVFADGNESSWSRNMNAHDLAKEAIKNALIGGDVLIILRPKAANGTTSIQLVDGANVLNPTMGAAEFTAAKNRGNTIEHGIELNKNGEHIAYFVRQRNNKFVRVPARGPKSKRLMATLFVGNRYRTDSVRGIPLLVAVLETIKKLDRYKEAVVGSAEERAKIPFTIEHDELSTGANTLAKNAVGGLNVRRKTEQTLTSRWRIDSPNHIATTTGKQVFNMEPGSKLTTPFTAGGMEDGFTNFFDSNINIVCAVLGIPPDVAKMMYNNSFSASRAALQDWAQTLRVQRDWVARGFYKPFYNLFLELQVLIGKITAPGLIRILRGGDPIAIGAYLRCRFFGANVPHIDPEKEVRAERAKLGPLGANIPLGTVAQSMENLGSGEFDDNINAFEDELNGLPSNMTPQPPAGQ